MPVAYSDTLTKNTRTLKHLGQLKQKMQKFETSVAGFDQGKGKPSVPGRTFSTYHAETWPSLGSHHCYAYAPLGAQCVGEEDLRLFLTQPAFTHTNLQFTRHMFATQSKTHTHARTRIYQDSQIRNKKSRMIFSFLQPGPHLLPPCCLHPRLSSLHFTP